MRRRRRTEDSGGKAPAYQWFPKDARTDERFLVLTWEQRGLFQGLLDHQWLHGSIPADVNALHAILGGRMPDGSPMTVDYLAAAWPPIAACFSDAGDGRLINERLERQRRSLAAFTKDITVKRRAAANKRWHGERAEAMQVHDSSISDLPSSTAVSNPPAPQPASDTPADLFTGDPSPTQVDALVQLWNTERKPGPHVMRSLPSARRQRFARALKAAPNLDDWRTVIRFLNHQDFANACGHGDYPNWRASLDWLSKPGKLGEYLERARLQGNERQGNRGRDASKGRTGVETGKYDELRRRV